MRVLCCEVVLQLQAGSHTSHCGLADISQLCSKSCQEQWLREEVEVDREESNTKKKKVGKQRVGSVKMNTSPQNNGCRHTKFCWANCSSNLVDCSICAVSTGGEGGEELQETSCLMLTRGHCSLQHNRQFHLSPFSVLLYEDREFT